MEETTRLGHTGLLAKPGLRQFAKFCIVGASSTVISASIFILLVYYFHLDNIVYHALAGNPRLQTFAVTFKIYIQIAAFIGFMFAVTNGFIWNSRWTFPQTNKALRKVQYARFVAVNVIGLVLNQIIVFIVNNLLTVGKTSTEKGWEPLIAFAVATGTVVFWNFFANKNWTFRKS